MGRQNIFFTAGPAELYPKFEAYLQDAIDLQIGSISHRSGQFKKIHQHTDEQLRALMNIPAEHAIMFTGSASEIWEKILLSCVEHESFHLVNGSFSEKFWKYAQSLGRHTGKMSKPVGEGFSYHEIAVPEYAELICVTQNETSSGVQMREPEIHKLKRSHSGKLIAVDMVSSAPHPELDFSVIDTAFFSVQKAFGMPAGLGVWIAAETCLAKAMAIKEKGISLGAHHDLPTLWKDSRNFQNPATPNVLGIYILGRIAEDMNKTGIETIRKETEEKARMIYRFFEKKEGYAPAVALPEHRSRTVAVINTEAPSSDIISILKAQNIIIGSGYGPGKDSQIRISNFPANTREQVEKLLNTIENI